MAPVMRQRARTTEERLAALIELQGLLARVAREIGPALELQPVLTTVLAAMRSVMDFRGGTICLVDERGVYIAANDPPVGPEMTELRVPVGTGLAGWVVAHGEPVYSPDVQNDPRVDPAIRAIGTNATMRSYLGVPLVCLGKVIGLLQVDSEQVDAFDADDLRVLQGLAVQVAGAIESARRHEQVLELERLKSDFIARVSHELRTPLTIIAGFTDTLLARTGSLSAEQRLWVERIRAAGERLSGLVEELLMVSSMEAGMAQVRPADVDVAAVAAEVRDRSAGPERVTVAVPAGLRLRTDPTLLRHALGLLVDNALKYAGDAEIQAGPGWVAVRDHGPGVPPAKREQIFERFTRGDQSTPGMGLGLPVVRNIATALGATVAVEDAPGGGARFVLRFT
jgi:two-component system sensor histidine kinase/response regulator